MAGYQQTLVEEGTRQAEPEGELGNDDWSIEWRTLAGGLSDGVQTVTLSNGRFSVVVCPTRGMGVLNADADGTFVGWQSPVAAPVHPRHVNLHARNKLGWLEGFNELLCRCGLSSNGPPGTDEGAASPIESDLTLHGRIANTPAHRVEVGFDENRGLWIEGVCREATLFGPQLELRSRLSIPADATRFEIDDEITNQGARATDLQLLYHINVGSPFLEDGAQFATAFRNMSPRDQRAAEDVESYTAYLKPTPGYAEQVYFFDPISDAAGNSVALLRNARGTLGLSVTYNRDQLPCLSQWKCTQAVEDGYVTGIEPGTNYPNFKSFERAQGRVVSLEPGQTYRSELAVEVHLTGDSVDAVASSIDTCQRDVEPTVHDRPAPPFALS